jgi:hypothetical protein
MQGKPNRPHPRGEKPSDLLLQQPTKFEFAIIIPRGIVAALSLPTGGAARPRRPAS